MSERPASDGEFVEFGLGPNDNADGSSPSDQEEIRRLRSLNYHAQRLLEKNGLAGEAAEHPPEPTAPTTRSQDIREIAEKAMSNADNRVRTRVEHAKIESPDGWKVSRTSVHLGALDDLAGAVKSLANSAASTIAATIRGSAKVCVRFGGWFKADATTSVGSEPDIKDEAAP